MCLSSTISMAKYKKAKRHPDCLEMIREHLGLKKGKFAEFLGFERTGLSKKSKQDERTLSADELIEILETVKRKIERGDYRELIFKLFID